MNLLKLLLIVLAFVPALAFAQTYQVVYQNNVHQLMVRTVGSSTSGTATFEVYNTSGTWKSATVHLRQNGQTILTKNVSLAGGRFTYIDHEITGADVVECFVHHGGSASVICIVTIND